MTPVALSGRAEGYSRLALETVDSTNRIAMQHGQDGHPSGLWVTGTRQTAGKGSRGRSWTSEPGNLYASLMIRHSGPLEVLPQLAFVTSLAVRDAIIEGGAETASMTLKWPNDVLLNGYKCAGILLESSNGPGECLVVIGCGINCTHAPARTRHPATSLAAQGIFLRPDELFGCFSGTMANRLRQWDSGSGFAAIRADWVANAEGLGSPVRIEVSAAETVAGTFADIDGDGHLMVRLADGSVRSIPVGDIFFPQQGQEARG